MNIYLVGGAVRDQLLKLPVKERDWVVVGALPNDLLAEGFRQVGRDFPVFLHPETQEEYALARTERKQGSGYYGFVCDYNPHITLEEDLARRDLTINAMAMDSENGIIDPYGGQEDLKAKMLRHVSPAFVEDPVRVLRIARFAARFHDLGFNIAPETRALMYRMVSQGELDHLVPERVWQEWYRSLAGPHPEVFLTTLRASGALLKILPELDALFGVPNWRRYHPEVDSGIHTLMVLKQVTLVSEEPIVRLAALLHDLGKAKTPESCWPSHIGHEKKGVECIDELCKRLRIPSEYRKFASLVARFHLTIHRLFELRASTIVSTLEQTDAFRRPEWFERLLLVCEADAGGKGQLCYPQANHWRFILKACAQLKAKTLVSQGYTGRAIKEELHKRRVERVAEILTNSLEQ